MAPATSLPVQTGNDVLFPPMYEFIVTVFPILFLILSITIAVVEYRRRKDLVASLGWGALVLFLPIIGFVIWVVAALIRRENRTAIKS